MRRTGPGVHRTLKSTCHLKGFGRSELPIVSPVVGVGYALHHQACITQCTRRRRFVANFMDAFVNGLWERVVELAINAGIRAISFIPIASERGFDMYYWEHAALLQEPVGSGGLH